MMNNLRGGIQLVLLFLIVTLLIVLILILAPDSLHLTNVVYPK